MSDNFLEDLKKSVNNTYISDSLKGKIDLNSSDLKDVFFVKINGQNYDLQKYKNSKNNVVFTFLLEKPLFKKIILSNLNKIDLYVDDIKAKTFNLDKENIKIKIKKIKNNYKIKISLKRNVTKKEIL